MTAKSTQPPRKPAVNGSHYIFRRGTETFPLPYRKPTVKAPYVRAALRLTEDED